MIVLYHPSYLAPKPFLVNVGNTQWNGSVAEAASIFGQHREPQYPSACVWIVPGTFEE